MDPTESIQRSPANRLGLDYRSPPPRKLELPIIDVHTHVKSAEHATRFFEVATLYGIHRVVSMTPLEQVQPLRQAWGERIEFIAIPDWSRESLTPEFREDWLRRLEVFREHGSRLCKFWMAPPMRARHGLTLDHAYLRPVIDAARDLGYAFMVHVGDPSVWWNTRYADVARYGTKAEQYPQLEWLADYVAPRPVLCAHMGGFVEDLAFLQGLLQRHANCFLDSSATKWIVREVAWQPSAVREFICRNADRVLFGTDLVVDSKFDDFDHYASRYWVHQMLWETDCRGESPIEDPDAPDPPPLSGVDLPPEVLRRFYVENARRILGF